MPTRRVLLIRWRDAESSCPEWKDLDEYIEHLEKPSHTPVTTAGIAIRETPESITILQSISDSSVHSEIAIPTEGAIEVLHLYDVEVPEEFS